MVKKKTQLNRCTGVRLKMKLELRSCQMVKIKGGFNHFTDVRLKLKFIFLSNSEDKTSVEMFC